MYDAGVSSPLAAALATLAPLVPRIEAERRLPREAVDALVAAGVFKLLVPHAYGGAGAEPRVAVETIEAIAQVDGSAGWCAMIALTSSLMCDLLDDATAREVYGPADAITCGVFAPMGRAIPEGDGYRVSGRWSFASGCEHSQWRMAGTLAPGSQEVLSVLLRADQTRIEDTWHASGLRGTGSHDFVVEDALVPRTHAFSLVARAGSRRLTIASPRPFFGILSACIAGVGLGLGRAAIDAFSAIARDKKLPGGKKTIATRELVPVDVARAEARLGAARAYLYEQLAGDGSLHARARLRLAAVNAVEAGAEVTTAMFRAGGGGAVYARSPLQRYQRDAQVVAQHIMVSSLATTTAGRVLLDIESDTSTL